MYNRRGIIYTNAEKPGYGKFDPYELENGGWRRFRGREIETEREWGNNYLTRTHRANTRTRVHI